MGEMGCGKIFLIRYFFVICQVDFQILSIYVGVIEDIIKGKIIFCDNIVRKYLKNSFWLFLDEINICDYLGFICDVFCYYYCKGKLLFFNLKIFVVCNLYRFRFDELIYILGFQGKIKIDQLLKLVYRVYFFLEIMIDFVWDYGSL